MPINKLADRLLAEFAPVLYFHHHEEFFPISFACYVEHSELVAITPDEKRIVLAKKGTLTANSINQKSPQQWLEEGGLDLKSELFLDPDINAQEMKGTMEHCPVHTQMSTVTFKQGSETKDLIRLTYTFIYANNNPDQFFGLIGQHKGDIEHVTVYVEPMDENYDEINLQTEFKINRVYFSAHSALEGNWVSANKLDIELGHPVVYVAKGSHANYRDLGWQFFSKTHGSIPRIFGIANDKVEKNQDHRYAISTDDILPVPGSAQCDDDIGVSDDIDLGKEYFLGAEPTKTSSFFFRMLPLKILAEYAKDDHAVVDDSVDVVWPEPSCNNTP